MRQLNKTLWPFVVLFSCLAIFVQAVPPFIATSGGEGFTLGVTHSDYYPLNSNISIYVHVYNESNYLIYDGVLCKIHFYDYLNREMTENQMVLEDNEFRTYFDNTSYYGMINYLLFCNSTNGAGISQNSFLITQDGTKDSPSSFIAVIILLPLLLSFLLIIGAFNMSQEHNVVRIFLYLLSMFPFFVSLNWSVIALVKFYNFPELQNAIGSTVLWFGLMVFTIIIYFLIYAFYKMIETARKAKQEEIQY